MYDYKEYSGVMVNWTHVEVKDCIMISNDLCYLGI